MSEDDPTDVPLTEQYVLAELIRDHIKMWDEPREPSPFAIRVLEEYGMTDPERDTCPEPDVLAPWTADEVKDIR
jgi:hypothetical protein